MTKQRLDQALVARSLIATRSQAENYVKLGNVLVAGKIVTKAGLMVDDNTPIQFTAKDQYVSRAGLKLASVAGTFKLNFRGRVVLDVGSSTGGFTDYALQHGAVKVIAVEAGTDQMHIRLAGLIRIELHEKTDIRDFNTTEQIDIVVADLSFVSLRDILPSIAKLCNPRTQIVVLVKPQFEAATSMKHKGVIKNDKIRRSILKDFEAWASVRFRIVNKADSEVTGAKGNRERFYLLQIL